MFKKITAALTFAVVALAPVAPAAAWEEVCMKFPLWKTAFIGFFSVIHDYQFQNGLPRSISSRNFKGADIQLPRHIANDKNPRTENVVFSGNFAANQSQCVDIRHIPNGQNFVVLVHTTWEAIAHCSTHSSNPNIWYTQQQRPFRKIWWQAWGAAGSPTCHYWRETH